MKFAFALMALLAASVEATKISREMIGRSMDDSNNDNYSALEQMDHDLEI